MGQSLLKIAEKCKYEFGSGDLQTFIALVKDVYATVAKNEWYENRADGISEVDGEFLYMFGSDGSLVSAKDDANNMYYIQIPSSYLRLPHQMGINLVCYLGNMSAPFVRIGAGSLGMWEGLKSSVLGGNQTYFTIEDKMYFPKMTASGKLFLNLAIALDVVDIDQDLNIPGNIVDKIVELVKVKLGKKPEGETKAMT